MTRSEFNGGWKMLEGIGWPGTRNPEIYFGALQDLDARQWAKAVATAISNCDFFPVPKALREMAGAVADLNVEAVTAFEAVCEATVHRLRCAAKTACDCTEDRYDQHLIRQRLGDGAADAFLAAGGSGAFAHRQEGDPFLVKLFSAAYVERVKVDGSAGLRALPAAPLPQLPAVPEVTREAAKSAVEQIAERAGVTAEPAKPMGPNVVVLTDERRAALEAQRAAILDAEPVSR
jgi:hypothetical protein